VTLAALILTGVLGSLHCVGMCGGFVLALDRPGRAPGLRVGAQGLFHLGKTATYVCLGGLVGLLGASLVRAPVFSSVQTLLAVVAGLLMLLFGLQILGLVPELPTGSWFGPSSPYGRAVRAATNARGASAPLLLGALTGFLPCPLVYAFLAYAIQTGSILGAMGTMAVLGACTVPALSMVAGVGALVTPHLRLRLVKVAGAVVVLLGIVTVVRGAFPDLLHGLGGHQSHG
jgi:sulfite exporter TauE/SafE